MKEVGASGHLLLVEMAAPSKVQSSTLKVRLDGAGVAAVLVEGLDARKRGAHGAAYEKDGLLIVDLVLCLPPLRGDAKVPWIPVLVHRGQVKGCPWEDAKARMTSRGVGNSGR